MINYYDYDDDYDQSFLFLLFCQLQTIYFFLYMLYRQLCLFGVSCVEPCKYILLDSVIARVYFSGSWDEWRISVLFWKMYVIRKFMEKINVVLVNVIFLWIWGNVSVYRCCVELFIIFDLVPILIHTSITMCNMVALHCGINIINCISKTLFTNVQVVKFSFV